MPGVGRPAFDRNNRPEGTATMSDSSERPAAEVTPPAPPSLPGTPGARPSGGPGTGPEGQTGNHAGSVNNGPAPGHDPREALKRALDTTRLPAEVKEQLL